MLNVRETIEGGKAEFALDGRLDTVTAPELEQALKGAFDVVSELTLDFSGLEYISSAGLRVLLTAHKAMNGRGGMKLRNVNETVMEILEVTGFTELLTIE